MHRRHTAAPALSFRRDFRFNGTHMLTKGERDFIESAIAPVPGAREVRQEHELDMRGVPMPACYVRVRRALGGLEPGKQLLVAVTAEEAQRGFPVLARLLGHELVEQHAVDGEYFFVFRRH